jgi:FAD-dependent urate hydroxylase
MESRSLDIIVAGAGIGGLSAARALQLAGHRVRIFERTRALRPVGAAISIWPNGVKVLRALGVGAALDSEAGGMDFMSYRDRDGRLLTRFSLQPLYQAVGERAKPVARMALQRLLLEAVGEQHVQLGAACERYEQDADGVTVHLAGGASHRADLFVVSDGSRSQLRNQVTGRTIERQYRGYVNWNGRVPIHAELAEADCWEQFVGEGKRVSLMPMGNGEFYFFFDVPVADPEAVGVDVTRGATASLDGAPAAAGPEAYRALLAQHFDGWAPQVGNLIQRLDPALIASVAIHDTDPVPKLADGRVVMIGDAAHAMAPDLGQGGCQAMEDAWVLARLLDSEAERGLEAALTEYERLRLPRVHSIVERARKRAALIHGGDPADTQAWYDELRTETGAEIIAGLRKTVEGGPFG